MTDQAIPVTLDFDAARRERKGTPKTLRIGGKVHVLPPSIPAIVALDIARIQRERGPDAVPTFDEMSPLIEPILGPDARTIIADNQLDLVDLAELLKQVFELYQGDATPPPNRKSRRAQTRQSRSTSSSRGPSSRRTSSASTASSSASR
jgi:hypothetical protein